MHDPAAIQTLTGSQPVPARGDRPQRGVDSSIQDFCPAGPHFVRIGADTRSRAQLVRALRRVSRI
jgi:hypothetical protein